MTHLEETLQRDIDRISQKIREMAQLAERALRGALQALAEANRQLAYSVILRDQRIDELEKEVDRLCLEFIVRQQPVGRHLRFAYATIKVNAQLERVGDYAESIARQVLSLCNIDAPLPLELFRPIADLAIPMVASAAEAFTSQNPELAKRTLDNEDSVDKLRHQLSHQLLQLRLDNQIPLEALTPLHNIVNRFERVADQARNICQDVLYMCTGEYVKHLGSDVYRVLFVDDRNDSISQIAECIGYSLNQPLFVFTSAGLERRSVDPVTLDFLRKKGLGVERQTAKALGQVPYLDQYHIIIALSEAAQAAFPPPPTKVVCLDWSKDCPTLENRTDEDLELALERVYRFLYDHIKDLVEAVLVDDRS